VWSGWVVREGMREKEWKNALKRKPRSSDKSMRALSAKEANLRRILEARARGTSLDALDCASPPSPKEEILHLAGFYALESFSLST